MSDKDKLLKALIKYIDQCKQESGIIDSNRRYYGDSYIDKASIAIVGHSALTYQTVAEQLSRIVAPYMNQKTNYGYIPRMVKQAVAVFEMSKF
jgi:hypothetical protein